MTVRALRALARAYGVQRQFVGAHDERVTASDDTLLALLQLLGAPVTGIDDADDALRAYEAAHVAQVVDPVIVQWGNTAARASIRTNNSKKNPGDSPLQAGAVGGVGGRSTHVAAAVAVELEDGATREWSLTADERGQLPLPEALPVGVHTLHVTIGDRTGDATLLAAPRRLRAGEPRFGVFAPMYALHEHGQRDTGTVTTFNRFAHWAGATGASVIGTLPVLATFFGAGAEPCEPSPYVPVSRRHWNEVYVDLDLVPEANGTSVEPSPGPLVDLPALAAVKRPLLERALAALPNVAARHDEFERWLASRPDIVNYARFRAAVEQFGAGTRETVPSEHPTTRYHSYVQWLIEGQLARLEADMRERDQHLYLDLPIGAHPDGYDVATQPELFARGASAGAPPDAFFSEGQSWGFPPVLPHAARASGHRYLRECFDAHFRVARWLRVDHVIGFHRMWWVPTGASAKEGAYVTYPAEEQYALLAIAAAKVRGRVIGENLGTVPPQTNRALRQRGMLGMYVVPFAFRADATLREPEPFELACLDTHDTATFATFWHDLDPEPRGQLMAVLRESGHLDTPYGETVDPADVLSALLAYLGSTQAEVVFASLEDLWLETNAQNIPGTTGEQHPNFRRRTARSLADLEASTNERDVLCRLDRARRSSER